MGQGSPKGKALPSGSPQGQQWGRAPGTEVPLRKAQPLHPTPRPSGTQRKPPSQPGGTSPFSALRFREAAGRRGSELLPPPLPAMRPGSPRLAETLGGSRGGPRLRLHACKVFPEPRGGWPPSWCGGADPAHSPAGGPVRWLPAAPHLGDAAPPPQPGVGEQGSASSHSDRDRRADTRHGSEPRPPPAPPAQGPFKGKRDQHPVGHSLGTSPETRGEAHGPSHRPTVFGRDWAAASLTPLPTATPLGGLGLRVPRLL